MVNTALAIGKTRQKSQNKAGNVQYSQVRNTTWGFWWQFVWFWDVGEVESFRCLPGRARTVFFLFPTHPETLRNEQFHLFVLLMAVFSWYKEILSTCIRSLSHRDVEQISICCSWLGRASWEKSAGSWGRNLRIWSALSCLTVCSDLAWKFLLFGVPVVRISEEGTVPLIGVLLYCYFYLGLAKPLGASWMLNPRMLECLL